MTTLPDGVSPIPDDLIAEGGALATLVVRIAP